MARLLIVHHSPTGNTRRLGEALIAGAHDDAIEGVDVVALPPDRVRADDINAADALLFLTPANFGYMAGLVKDLFDRTFLQIGGALSDTGDASSTATGRIPYGLCVHGRYDTEGAIRSVQSLAQALPWTQGAAVMSVLGDVTADDEAAAYELGATMAALIA